jgi:hypothetical protein
VSFQSGFLKVIVFILKIEGKRMGNCVCKSHLNDLAQNIITDVEKGCNESKEYKLIGISSSDAKRLVEILHRDLFRCEYEIDVKDENILHIRRRHPIELWGRGPPRRRSDGTWSRTTMQI